MNHFADDPLVVHKMNWSPASAFFSFDISGLTYMSSGDECEGGSTHYTDAGLRPVTHCKCDLAVLNKSVGLIGATDTIRDIIGSS